MIDDNKSLYTTFFVCFLMPPSWEKPKRSEEDVMEEKIRNIMLKRRITYQEASQLVKAGQKSIFEF